MQLSKRLQLMGQVKPEYDNLRLVAISNIRGNNEQALRIWWHRKYGIPPKPIDDYTFEELLIEYFEDFYVEHPDKADEFMQGVVAIRSVGSEVDMTVPESVKRILAKRKKDVDLSKYKTAGDEDLTDEQCQAIFDSIKGIKQIGPNREIDDDFTKEKR